MKAITLIFVLLISLNIYAQKLPITGLCWGDVFSATGTTCSPDAFSSANPAYFDPTYAVSGNCLDDFRNYGAECTTRPTGLTNYILVNQYHDTGDVTHYVTDFSSACTAAAGLITGDYVWESTPIAQASSITTGNTLYAGTGIDCSVIDDGWYVVSSNGAFSFVGIIQVSDGIMTLHYCYW